MKNLLLLLLAIALVVAGGCGPSDRAPTAPVTGDVAYDGEPLRQGVIIFETPGARPANGRIENGRIVEVTTYESDDGAPIGNHQVAIQAVELAGSAVASDPAAATNPADYMNSESLIPTKYGDPATSGLSAEITEDRNNLSFELEAE